MRECLIWVVPPDSSGQAAGEEVIEMRKVKWRSLWWIVNGVVIARWADAIAAKAK